MHLQTTHFFMISKVQVVLSSSFESEYMIKPKRYMHFRVFSLTSPIRWNFHSTKFSWTSLCLQALVLARAPVAASACSEYAFEALRIKHCNQKHHSGEQHNRPSILRVLRTWIPRPSQPAQATLFHVGCTLHQEFHIHLLLATVF